MPLSRREFLRISSLTPAAIAAGRLEHSSQAGYCQLPPYPIVNFTGEITTPKNQKITAFRTHTDTDHQIDIPHPEDYMQLKVVSPHIPFLELNRQALLAFNPVETRITYRSSTDHSYGTANFPLTEVLKQDGLALTMSYLAPKPVNLYIGHNGITSTPCTNYAEVSDDTKNIDVILLVLSRGMYKLQTTADNEIFSVLEPSEELYFYIEGLNLSLLSSTKDLPPRKLVTA